MESGSLGDNLIFLISQPRSGSTLLQHILAGHPRIDTRPEPWLMLHLLYPKRAQGLAAEYDARTAHVALSAFLSGMGSDGDPFVESVRVAAGHLYAYALEGSTADIFLDKTPRYYHIVDELREVFPRARMIFLYRNPLAVFSSILHTHAAGDWTNLRRLDRMHDLMTAPQKMVRASNTPGDWRTAIIRYEDLVADPDGTLSSLCERLDLEFLPDMKRYVASRAPLGDETALQHQLPVDNYLDRWRRDLDTPIKRNVARSYVDALGPDLILELGYDFDELIDALPGSTGSVSLWESLTTPDELLPWWRRLRLAITHSIHQRGVMRTIARCAFIVLRGHAWTGQGDTDHIDRRPV